MSNTAKQTRSAGADTPGLHADHITPVRTYLVIAAALFVLTVVTVFVAQVDLGNAGLNIAVALVIAATKATLVALFFMHLLHDNKLYAAFFVGSVFFLALFIVITMFDTEYRTALHLDQERPINERARIYDEEGRPLNAKSHDGQSGHGEGEARAPAEEEADQGGEGHGSAGEGGDGDEAQGAAEEGSSGH